MRHLVVNADDLGLCAGVDEGIVEAHRRGVVTSASLLVGMPGSERAARLARACPGLSVGLHALLEDERGVPLPPRGDAGACRAALAAQAARFTELLGRPPTHLDSHHHVHPEPALLPHFRELAERWGVPLRACSGVAYCSRFYGRWGGRSHPEQVGVERLLALIDDHVGDGVTELGCHPARPDPALRSSYREERALELRTLCDARVRGHLRRHGIRLVGFDEVPRLLGWRGG